MEFQPSREKKIQPAAAIGGSGNGWDFGETEKGAKKGKSERREVVRKKKKVSIEKEGD